MATELDRFTEMMQNIQNLLDDTSMGDTLLVIKHVEEGHHVIACNISFEKLCEIICSLSHTAIHDYAPKNNNDKTPVVENFHLFLAKLQRAMFEKGFADELVATNVH